jgi:hypothetical protein
MRVLPHKYHSSVELIYFNCKDQRTSTAYAVYYEKPYGGGKTVHAEGKTSEPPASTFQETVPDSYGELLLSVICDK